MKIWWLLIFLVVIPGCASYMQISDIKDNPIKYQDQQVSIKGRVSETLAIPFVNKGLYQIEDDTGRIWVLSKDRVPYRGDKLIVVGKVKNAFTISGRTFGTVIVEDRKSAE